VVKFEGKKNQMNYNLERHLCTGEEVARRSGGGMVLGKMTFGSFYHIRPG
jgi:hypothetical protein